MRGNEEMVKRNGRWAAAAMIAAASMLSACATPIPIGPMTVPLSSDAIITQASPAYKAISLGTVTGGKDTNPLWISDVSNQNFHDALEQSLELYVLEADGAVGRYRLDVALVSIDQPAIGLDFTVTTKVHYTLVPKDGGPAKFDQTIETPYTAKFGDAFLGYERSRLATEGAVRENISAFIKQVMATLQAAPVARADR
jgi:hypothetical protein